MINHITGSQTRRQTSFEIYAICSLLWLFFVGALVAMLWNWTNGTTTLILAATELRQSPFSLGFRIDTLSTIMLAMITLLGALIAHYSVSYLIGEQRQTYFFRYLLLVILSTALLVTSNSLIVLYLAWLGTSLFLHKLLIYYDNRPQALSAAKKKFIVSRIGDLSLLLAIGLTYQVFNTFELQELFQKANAAFDGSDQSKVIGLIGFFFALGAMFKSVQFPFHFWLPETMEAPTPVSALMHAGIINAGGFLMIRLSPILEDATAAHILLASVGSTTAVFGALVMITQNHLKGKLAFSTISQMGMMLFACGLGLYSLALFHIIAHSFYKSYAFLNTGMQVEESKQFRLHQGRPSQLFLGSVTIISLSLIFLGLAHREGLFLPYYTYCAILLMGISQTADSIRTRQASFLAYSKIALLLTASATSFLLIEYYLKLSLNPLVPNIHTAINWHSPQFLLCIFCYLIFASGFWLSAYLPQAEGALMKRLYCYFWNGGYFTAYTSILLSRYFGKTNFVEQHPTKLPTAEHANA